MIPTPLRILLAEGDELFRLGLCIRLQQETGIEILAEAEDVETAVALAKQLVPDLVLLDMGLPAIGGIEACRQIKQLHRNLPILVLTSQSQASLIGQLVQTGAQGYCFKGVPVETLVLAIRSIASGASWWDQNATIAIRHAFEKISTAEPSLELNESDNPLTQREQEVLALIAAGKTNQEIAAVLQITIGTVKVHVHTLLQKLDAHDRTQAVVIAVKQGLLSLNLLSRVSVSRNGSAC